jgi:hypothetical protein
MMNSNAKFGPNILKLGLMTEMLRIIINTCTTMLKGR